MIKKESEKLLAWLLSNKFISETQRNELSNKQFASFTDLEGAIKQLVILSEEDWTQAKGIYYGLEYRTLMGTVIESEILNILPQDLADNYHMVVFGREGESLLAGLVDPTDLKAVEALNFLARKKQYGVKYFIISQDSYRSAIKQYETLGQEVGEALGTAEEIFGSMGNEMAVQTDSSDVVKSAPVSKIVSVVLRHAIEGRASDIHIEPVGKQSKVRYRIDGILHTTIVLPIYVHAALISRIKVMANLKIDETRIPQDGRIRLNVHNKEIDIRVSTLPLMGQEKVVMRLLETPDKAPTFADLGFFGLQSKIVFEAINQPHGLFLVTGPTGSGKSTTLYAGLSFLNKDEINIATLEDPVEYYIPGVNQAQIKPEVNFTFATGLRSLLRQDPDIIMVGEIRDNETAELAIHASLTGHSVLTTLHTNDAMGAIPRLFDMKVEPFLLANTLNAVVAQRLVRKLCNSCKVETDLPAELKAQVTEELSKIPKEAYYSDFHLDNIKFYKSVGCVNCSQTGYKGRLSIVEAIEIKRELQEVVAKGFDRHQAEAELAKQHFISMQQDGLIKVALGWTTIEEVMRVSKS
ncbi:MAG: type pilus assembly protein PilB [Patescibacteria group bacterium]|jgi:type IV pilus assembly protein PilB|nr:type pilus assembly protein PilB [Patescibacteria group bacterium]